MIKVTQVRSFLWNALETRMCVHRCSLHQRASAASAKRVNTMQKKTTGCRNSFCGVKQTFYIAWSRQLYPSMHHCPSLVRLCAMAVSIDIRYKPLLACAHECKPNLVVLWPMGQSNHIILTKYKAIHMTAGYGIYFLVILIKIEKLFT